MSTNNITAADSVFMLSIAGLYDVPQQLQGYMADAAFDTDSADAAELVMGVDGIMSAGFTPFITRQTISIMPDSPSSLIFEDWLEANKSRKDNLRASAVITMPAIGRTYTLSNGVLVGVIQIPPAHRVLQGRAWGMAWGNVSPAAFG